MLHVKKAVILFDEKTILNFPFMFSLSFRYKFLLYSLPFAIFLTTLLFYKTQHTIYGQEVSLSTNNKGMNNGQGGSNPMAALFGDDQQFLSKNELMAIFKSYDFLDSFAKEVLDHPDFNNFNFNSIHAKKLVDTKEIFAPVKDRAAKIEILQGMLPNFYTFDSGMAEHRYSLKIHTLDSVTTQALTDILVKVIVDYRVKQLRGSVDQQVLSYSELMARGHEDLKLKGGHDVHHRQASLDSRILDSKERLRATQQALNIEKRTADALEIQVKQGRDLLEREDLAESKGRLETFGSLRLRLKEVTSNINSITTISEHYRTPTDNSILEQLKAEASRIRSQMALQGRVERHLAGQDVLDIDKEKSNAGLAFEYEVSKKKRQRLAEDVDKLQLELDKLISEKVEVDRLLVKVAPDLEYIKMLEGKIVSLKLLATTIVSDVLFDKYSKSPSVFTKSSLLQILIFAVFMNLFIYMGLNIFFFFMDDRIHEEAELRTYFKEFQIIGRTPEFE